MSKPGTPSRNGRASHKTPTKRVSPRSAKGLVPLADVNLLYAENEGRPHVKVGTAVLFGTMVGELATVLHGHDIRKLQNEEHDVVLVYKARVEPGKEALVYPYKMPDNEEEPAPKCLGDMQEGRRYAWDVDMMEATNDSGKRSATVSTGTAARKPQSKMPHVVPIPSGEKRPASPPVLQLGPPTKISRTGKGPKGRRPKTATKKPAAKVDEISPAVSSKTPGSDPDVEVDVTVPDQLSVPDIDLAGYRKVSVLVNVNNIAFMEHTVRDTDPQHVEALQKAIGEQGSLSSAGFLTVTVRDADNLQSLNEHIDNENRLNVESTGVDGRHRTLAYRKLQAQASTDKKRTEFTWVWAQMYTRADNKPMSELEVISVGAHLNDVSSTVRKSNFPDNVHNAMSCVALVQKQLNVPVEEVQPAMVAKVMASIRSIPGLQRTQYARYAQIAHAFTRNGMKANLLKDYPNLGVVHLAHPQYLKLDKPGMLLGLEAVSAYIRTPAPRGTTKGSFEDAGTGFYDSFRELYAQARASATQFQVPVTELLEEDVAITASKKSKLRHIIRNSLTSYSSRVNDRMRSVQKGRITKLRNVIMHHYGSTRGVSDTTVSNPLVDASRRSERSTAGRPPSRMPAESFRRPPAKKKPRAVPRKLVATDEGESSPASKDQRVTRAKRPVPRPEADKSPEDTGSDSTDSSPGDQNQPQDTPVAVRKDSDAIYEFDDDIPSLNPAGLNDPPVWKGEKRPDWVVYASVLPSQWPRMNPIQHASPWLEALHIPPQHRAHLVCKPEDLLAIHRAVYYHAAMERHREIGSTLRPVLDTVKLPRSPVRSFLGQKDTPAGALWAAACDRDELAPEYFGHQRGVLDSVGFCVLEGFTSDENIPARLGFPRCDPDGDVIGKLADYFASTFPGEDALRDEENRTLWSPIINTVTDEADRGKGVGRFITTLEGIAAHLEQDENLGWVVRKRAFLDARLGQLVVAMGLDKVGSSSFGVEAMAVPKTGGRFLLTGKGCQRQYLHTDFAVGSTPDEKRVPGYFVLCTTRSPTPLWVVNHSHFYLGETDKVKQALSNAVFARKVLIPPFSVLIGRGDLQHGGAGYMDFPNPTIKGCLRYHMYFVPHDRTLIDGIHLPSFLRPRFEDEVGDPETPRRPAGKGPRTTGRGTGVARQLDMSNESEDSDSSSGSEGSTASETAEGE